MSGSRSLKTILFTDVVASTRRAAELGDRLWSETLAEYRSLLRREIERFGGSEANLSGDGILATFERPAAALRCAWSIHELVRDLGLEVRSGLHAGEVEGSGQELSGIAVHTAVRIADAAEPGEIAASATVRELVAGTGFGFADRGTRTLEGVPDEKSLFALEKLPPGSTSLRTTRWVPELSVRQAKIGAAAIGVLVLLAVGAFIATRGGSDLLSPGPAQAGISPAVAVLPFDVSGPELEDWREGMVTLLSTGLDGAGELRAIDNRTVLAQWDQRVGADTRADRSKALEVARATGARYALLGSAVAVGSELRLVADLYSVEDGRPLGSAQVEGSPDSVLALADRLARESLGVLLEEGEGELPRVDLAALTTRSLPALKAYLAGESAYRVGRIEAATAAFEEAVEADSTFALAWNRLASARGWRLLELGFEPIQEARERAIAHSHRLPERERILVEAEWDMNRGIPSGVEQVREATRRFPDDAEAWYLLGEFYYHHMASLATLDDAEDAFLEAVELDPAFAPYRFHLTEFAFSSPPDSALAAERSADLLRRSPDTRRARSTRLALGLAFGDSVRRAAFLDSLPKLDSEDLGLLTQYLFHPRFSGVQERVLAEIEEKGGTRPLTWTTTLLKRGRLSEALDHVDDPGGPPWFPACLLLGLHSIGVPVPEDVLEEHLALRAADSLPGPRTSCGAVYDWDRGRPDELERAVRIFRSGAEEAYAEGDTLAARRGEAIAGALRAYARWQQGDPAAAVPAFEEALRWMDWEMPLFWLGQIHLERGEPAKAVPYFQALELDPAWRYHLGVAWEEAGEFEKANESYAFVVTHWADADPALRPFVERARQGMIRTGGLRRE